jgi:hypothetical protein
MIQHTFFRSFSSFFSAIGGLDIESGARDNDDGITSQHNAAQPSILENEAAQWDGIICVPVTYNHQFDIDVQGAMGEAAKTQGCVSIGPLGIPDR